MDGVVLVLPVAATVTAPLAILLRFLIVPVFVTVKTGNIVESIDSIVGVPLASTTGTVALGGAEPFAPSFFFTDIKSIVSTVVQVKDGTPRSIAASVIMIAAVVIIVVSRRTAASALVTPPVLHWKRSIMTIAQTHINVVFLVMMIPAPAARAQARRTNIGLLLLLLNRSTCRFDVTGKKGALRRGQLVNQEMIIVRNHSLSFGGTSPYYTNESQSR